MSFLQKMQKFSIQQVIDSVSIMMRRFPVVVVTTLLGTALGLYLVSVDRVSGLDLAVQEKTLMMCALAVPLFLLATLIAEKYQKQKYLWGLLHGISILLIVLYYFLLPGNPNDFSEIHVKRFFFFNIITYLFIFIAPFWDQKNGSAHWHYVYHLFLRICVTVLFSLILLLGVFAALWSIDYLFGIDIQGESYGRVFVLIAGIFATWYFLSGFPKDVKVFEREQDYPALFRVLTQFILVPLLTFFFIILYIYLGKIVFTWNWPLGGTGYWVIGYCGAAILTFVLGYPLQLQEKFQWLKKFFRALFILTIPLAIVLFMAIGIRIYYYGWTEQRYLVVELGVWLLFVSFYYLFSKGKELKMVPMSLALFLFFTMWGPWGMFSVSMQSQIGRLEHLLEQENLFVGGKVISFPKDHTYDYEYVQSVQSKFRYIIDHDGSNKIDGWFTEDIYKTSEGGMHRYDIYNHVLKILNIQEVYPRMAEGSSQRFFQAKNSEVTKNHPFEYVIKNIGLNSDMRNLNKQTFSFEEKEIDIQLVAGRIMVNFEGEQAVELLVGDLIDSLSRSFNQYQPEIPQEKMYLEAENESVKVGAQFNYIDWSSEKQRGPITNVGFDLYFSKK